MPTFKCIHALAPMLLLCAILSSIQAAGQLIDIHINDSIVRSNYPLQIDVSSQVGAPKITYPLQVQCEVFAATTLIYQQQCTIHRWSTLSQGLIFRAAIPKIKEPSVRCVLLLKDAQNQRLALIEKNVDTINKLYRQFNDGVNYFNGRKKSALAQLRLEQIALLLSKHRDQQSLIQAQQYLSDLQQIIKQAFTHKHNIQEHAFFARSDASAQPYRLYVDATQNDIKGVVICCLAAGKHNHKANWPLLPDSWQRAAQAAGLLCLQVYPAGDQQWQDLAIYRAQQAWHAAQNAMPTLKNKTLYGLGTGHGVDGCLRLATQLKLHGIIVTDDIQDQSIDLGALAQIPIACTGQPSVLLKKMNSVRPSSQQGLLTRIDIGNLTEQTAWTWLQHQQGHSTVSPVQHRFGSKPFICISGSGEHLAAKQQIQDIYHSLNGAWVAYSEGHLPHIGADAFTLAQYPDHDLVFLGNPQDNQALKQFLKRIPKQAQQLQWTNRHLSHPKGQDLRSEITSIQWQLQEKQRKIWVLSGSHTRFIIGSMPLQDQHSSIQLLNAQITWANSE